MLATNVFKQKLAARQVQIGLWSTLPHPYVVELLAGSGFDWIMLDNEHTPSDPILSLSLLQAVAASGPAAAQPVVRPAANDPVLTKRYLDLGAQTLLLPMIDAPQDAELAVESIRYPPRGQRGTSSAVRASRFGRDKEFLVRAEENTCLLVQIETVRALENLEAIAAVAGVDGLLIGPSDLAANLGLRGRMDHPDVLAAVDRAISRIVACGKAAGVLVQDPVRAQRCLDLGATFVAVGVDQVLLRNAADQLAASYADYASQAWASSPSE